MKKIFRFSAAFLCWVTVFFWGAAADSKGTGLCRLTKLWATEARLKVPESVLYHPSEGILYVSNINGKPTEKNGKGFISKISLDGRILALKWAAGLNAPKGSGIHQGRFFVADIDELVEIDLKTGNIVAKYPARGAGFLNDVTIDKNGAVYVSDMSRGNSVIYKLVKNKMVVWLKGAAVSQPNGLYADNGQLIVGSFGDGSLKAIDLKTKAIRVIARVRSGIDGVQADGKGNYFISDWGGKTMFVSSNGDVTVLMDTTAGRINSADIEFIEEKGMLLIPTFFDNRVMAYRVEKM